MNEKEKERHEERIKMVRFACKSVLGRNLTQDEERVLMVAYANGRDDGISDVEDSINGFD